MNGILRIETSFKRGPIFVVYLTAGAGGIKCTLAAALALVAGGTTLLEFGVHFSGPLLMALWFRPLRPASIHY